MVSIQRPPGPNLTVNNPNDVVYLHGNETTDGSIRLCLTPGDTIGSFELRTSGVWNDTSFRFNADSVIIGRDMQLSAAAGHLETFNQSEVHGHSRGLLPHIEFTDSGTTHLETPIVSAEQDFVVFSGAVSEIIATTIGIQLGVAPGRLIENSVHEVGSVGATASIQVSFYAGNSNAAPLFNRRILPASVMPADTQLKINYDNTLGFEGGGVVFMEFVSANSISLKTDASGNPLTTHNGHALEEVDILTENLMLDEDLNIMWDENLNPMFAIQFP